MSDSPCSTCGGEREVCVGKNAPPPWTHVCGKDICMMIPCKECSRVVSVEEASNAAAIAEAKEVCRYGPEIHYDGDDWVVAENWDSYKGGVMRGVRGRGTTLPSALSAYQSAKAKETNK